MPEDQEKRIAAATTLGATVANTILRNQVLLLRVWADNIERFAQNYEKEAQTVVSDIERKSQRAA